MKHTKATLVPLTADAREQFILDNQWSFKYGALEEFGERDDHIDGDGEIIYSVYIKDANTPTDEGLYIGDTLEQVSSIYGTDRTENGNELVYTAGKTLLVIIVENDTVTSIEFRADI